MIGIWDQATMGWPCEDLQQTKASLAEDEKTLRLLDCSVWSVSHFSIFYSGLKEYTTQLGIIGIVEL